MKLEICNLSKNFGSVCALKDVSVTLDNGIYGLLGPNGAGKSTMINLITDNIRRESGTISWNGQEIRNIGKSYRNILGYMPQQQGYYENFSAGAFLKYMSHLKGMDRKSAENKVSELLEVVNLKEHRNRRIGTFSGGMKQRLLLAQALLNDPQLLILDEPTAGVDPQERINIRNFISEIASDRIVILATHIVSDVEAIAKEILLMKKGEIIAKGEPYDLITQISDSVYEILIKPDELARMQKEFVICNIRHVKDGLMVKIISQNPPSEHKIEPVNANLEDVYLYYFGNDR